MGARRARGAGGAPSAPKVTWLLLLWYRCGLRAGEAAATQNEPAHLRVVLNSTLSGAARPAAVSGVNLGASRVNWSPSHQATSAAVRNFDVCARRVQPPQYLGPAAGHRYPEDGSWLAFLDHLGVNGARSLSCAPPRRPPSRPRHAAVARRPLFTTRSANRRAPVRRGWSGPGRVSGRTLRQHERRLGCRPVRRARAERCAVCGRRRRAACARRPRAG